MKLEGESSPEVDGDDIMEWILHTDIEYRNLTMIRHLESTRYLYIVFVLIYCIFDLLCIVAHLCAS